MAILRTSIKDQLKDYNELNLLIVDPEFRALASELGLLKDHPTWKETASSRPSTATR